MAMSGIDVIWRSRHLVIIGLTAVAITSIIRDGWTEPVTAIVGVLTTIMGVDKYLSTRIGDQNKVGVIVAK